MTPAAPAPATTRGGIFAGLTTAELIGTAALMQRYYGAAQRAYTEKHTAALQALADEALGLLCEVIEQVTL